MRDVDVAKRADSRLNESPSEKEGKFWNVARAGLADLPQ